MIVVYLCVFLFSLFRLALAVLDLAHLMIVSYRLHVCSFCMFLLSAIILGPCFFQMFPWSFKNALWSFKTAFVDAFVIYLFIFVPKSVDFFTFLKSLLIVFFFNFPLKSICCEAFCWYLLVAKLGLCVIRYVLLALSVLDLAHLLLHAGNLLGKPALKAVYIFL